jgi:hypothetical protein
MQLLKMYRIGKSIFRLSCCDITTGTGAIFVMTHASLKSNRGVGRVAI